MEQSGVQWEAFGKNQLHIILELTKQNMDQSGVQWERPKSISRLNKPIQVCYVSEL